MGVGVAWREQRENQRAADKVAVPKDEHNSCQSKRVTRVSWCLGRQNVPGRQEQCLLHVASGCGARVDVLGGCWRDDAG